MDINTNGLKEPCAAHKTALIAKSIQTEDEFTADFIKALEITFDILEDLLERK